MHETNNTTVVAVPACKNTWTRGGKGDSPVYCRVDRHCQGGKNIWLNSNFSFPWILIMGLYVETEMKSSKEYFVISVQKE